MSEIKVLKFRDEQVAEDVAKKAMLGWFDVEFIMYGCAYLDPKDDKLYYKISSNEDDIYNFVENSIKQQIYPSKVLSIRKRYPLPSGMKEIVAEEVKRELARVLKQTYPKEFFKDLYQMAEESRSNTAADILWEMAEQLEGVFEEKRLDEFEEFTNYSYSCHELDIKTYQKICSWLEEERRNMEDDYVSKDIFQKTMYGFIYEKNGNIKYMADAQRANIYRNICELEERGAMVGPIYSKTYWYDRKTSLASIVAKFKDELKEKIESGHLEEIQKIRKEKSAKGKVDFLNKIDIIRTTYGDKPAETSIRYGYRWGIL